MKLRRDKLGGALPATSRHTRHLPWLLPSGSDRVNKLVLRENQQDPIECLIAKTVGIIFETLLNSKKTQFK